MPHLNQQRFKSFHRESVNPFVHPRDKAFSIMLREALSETERANLDAAMLESARRGFRRDMDVQLREGASANAINAVGLPALFLASYPGCARTLLRWGAEPAAIAAGLPCILHHLRLGNLEAAGVVAEYLPQEVLEEWHFQALDVSKNLQRRKMFDAVAVTEHIFSL